MTTIIILSFIMSFVIGTVISLVGWQIACSRELDPLVNWAYFHVAVITSPVVGLIAAITTAIIVWNYLN